jgi:hypothetical protein
VLGLTDVCFEKDRPCTACQAGKQVGLTMGCKFCTIRFKDQVGLGSGFISSYF